MISDGTFAFVASYIPHILEICVSLYSKWAESLQLTFIEK
jgi:hypothetical protein